MTSPRVNTGVSLPGGETTDSYGMYYSSKNQLQRVPSEIYSMGDQYRSRYGLYPAPPAYDRSHQRPTPMTRERSYQDVSLRESDFHDSSLRNRNYPDCEDNDRRYNTLNIYDPGFTRRNSCGLGSNRYTSAYNSNGTNNSNSAYGQNVQFSDKTDERYDQLPNAFEKENGLSTSQTVGDKLNTIPKKLNTGTESCEDNSKNYEVEVERDSRSCWCFSNESSSATQTILSQTITEVTNRVTTQLVHQNSEESSKPNNKRTVDQKRKPGHTENDKSFKRLSTDSSRTPKTCRNLCCRSTFMLVSLMGLVVIFIAISTILFYTNYSSLKVLPKPIADEPCAKTFCPWGAHCVVNSDGRSICQCPTKCKDIYDPVCGTDGKTYRNLCILKMTTCKARSGTRIQYNGPCEIKDPCHDKVCTFGARCVLSSDGKEASCKCPETCHNYGDHVLSRAVCGSDGIDYNNMCELNKAACKFNSNITVKYQGKCDPCETVVCPEPEICQLDEKRNPICRCSESCPLEIAPVCASDGKTYENECFLRQEVCRTGKSISMMYSGKCTTDENPCEGLECKHYRECSIDKRGHATCVCPPPCEMKMKPVCGSDDRTYSSLCELKRTACTFNFTVEPAYQGVCGELGPCSHHSCNFGAVCQEKNGIAACQCFSCSSEFAPVCGSDGITYGNECKLKLEACKQQHEIRVIYRAPCDECENRKCDYYSICESSEDEGTQCVCPSSCTDSKLLNGPVCGNDGITYINECEMRMISCKSQRYVLVAYPGVCKTCHGENCQTDINCESGKCSCPTECESVKEEPVCASTNQTFSNECEFQKAACKITSGPPLTILFYGNCSERLTPMSTLTTFSSAGVETKLGNFELSQTKQLSKSNNYINISSTELNLEIVEKCRDIICDFDAKCEIGPDNFPRCTCQFDCSNTLSEQPVCASDNKIYSSVCAMKMEACQRQQELRLRPLEVCKGSEVRPCNGEKPVVDPLTNEEFDCGNNANRKDCPSGSYCHITLRVARCCPIEIKKESNSCKDSWYGCCPDEKTPAQGPNNAGCPSVCKCNKLGSYSKSCDPKTLQCPCKPGVGGQKCDSCLPGFWGLQHINKGSVGCIPCGCSAFGSVRIDCEQMTGRCVCKPGVQGNKCTFCSSSEKVLGPSGCVSAELSVPPPSTCKELTCHFGALCVEQGGTAFCDCYNECNEKTHNQIVCGSDGQTYTSSCQLQLLACRLQKDIVVQAFGSCKDDSLTGTELPYRRYTPQQFTQSDESNSPLSKSTRHLMIPDLRYYYDRGGPYLPAQTSYSENDNIGNGVSIENEVYSSGSNNFDARGEHIAAAYRPTPATVRVITALLGDLCSDDTECVILNSSCIGGACTCLPNFVEYSDRQACKESTTTEESRACLSSPCFKGSRCIDLPSSGFTCICPSNYTGHLCDVPLSRTIFDVPSFDGQAFIKLRPLKAYYKLSIEIEFKAYTNNGILLYNQQRENGQGDFVSLAIVNGFIEFRYNLGNGPTVIKSLDKIRLNEYHTVVIKRYRRDGFLKLDDEDSVVGQSEGTWEALDLTEETFIGNIITNYKKVYENIGTNQGLRGCIKRLKIGRNGVNLQGNVDEMVLGSKGLHECGSDPCSGSPCKNDGKCHPVDTELYRCECGPSFIGDFCESIIDPCLSNPCKGESECFSLDAENFMCQCPAGRKGKTCDLIDTNLSIKIPEFNGTSYLKLPTLKGVMKTFSMEVVFLTKALNGLILYNGQKRKNRGDFISLNIVGGFVQFRYNLGSGVANITSSKPIQLNKWHRLRILRDGREGFIQLDDTPVEKGWSGPSLTDLNLELPFFIGGINSWRELHRLSGANKGLKGALQRLAINGESIPISANFPECSTSPENITTCSFGVGLYDGPPCASTKTPCRNNGLCIPNLDDYICKCSPGFEGKHCQIVKENEISIKFSGDTFLQYRNRGYRNETYTDYGEDEAELEDKQLESEEDYEMDLNNYDFEPTESYDFDLDSSWRKLEKGNKYVFRLRTFEPDGLLLWRSKTRSIQEDYFSIAIVNGYPEFSYNLGKQKAFWAIRTKKRVDDGEWHTIDVRRRKKMGFLSVDHEPPIKGVSNNGAFTLSTNSKLWIGGMPSLPPGLPSAYYKGFEGCIKQVSISSKPLNLLKHLSPKKIEFCHDNEI